MADSVDVEEAMVVIQEAAADIRKATQQLSRSSLEKVGEQNQEILRSIENITNRLSTLEEAVTVSTQTSRRSRRSSRQPEISLYTRRMVRSVYRDLKEIAGLQFSLEVCFEAACNQEVVSKIVTELNSRNCACGQEEIQGACSCYYDSLRQDHQREASGSKGKHRQQLRRLRRKKKKVENRMSVFTSHPPGNWSSGKQARVRKLLTLPYASSEESGDESDLKIYRHPLPWIKRKYRKALHELDKLHYNSLPKSSKTKYMKRDEGSPSTRPPPEDAPRWAVTGDENLNSSMESVDCDN